MTKSDMVKVKTKDIGHYIFALAGVVVFFFVFMIGITMTENEKPEPTVVPYEIEIWDNGAVVVNTSVGYINQIDENTTVITDHDFDEVINALVDMQDVGDE